MNNIELSTQQKQIIGQISDWLQKLDKQFLTLGGYAGTGKTTLIAYLRKQLFDKNPDLKVAFCSFTGKATRVLSEKLKQQQSLFPGDNISTIHMLIYSPMLDDRGEVIGWERKAEGELKWDLIIVDEASMVSRDIWQDLLNFKTPILAVGDHGQLPPIGGNFNLMEQPELKLEEIYRQEAASPIIQLSLMARTSGKIPVGEYGINVAKYDRGSDETKMIIEELVQTAKESTLILCGYNNTRNRINQYKRQFKEFEGSEPCPGDRVICLRNNHRKSIYNGMLGTIRSIEKVVEKDIPGYYAKIELDGEDKMYKGVISSEQFNQQSTLKLPTVVDLFDFGYALTVHKSQGSQAKTVVLFEERFQQMDDDMWRRWLYTAVTRAEQELFIIGH